jgi:hypothetical protein
MVSSCSPATAARRYRNLNASANDSGRKRGQRTVQSYCLGRLSPDQLIRSDGARTYLFLVFRDGQKTFTIGLALEASPAESDARTLGQFIVLDRALSVADFIDRVGDDERPRDWALVRPWLENEAKAKVYRDEPRKFVSDYLKAGSTGQRFVDADRLLKAFVNAISFEQIDSATDFVRRYLLDKRDIRIGQLKESIATYQQLRKNIEEARNKLEPYNGGDPSPGQITAGAGAILSLGRYRPSRMADPQPHSRRDDTSIATAPDGPGDRGGAGRNRS